MKYLLISLLWLTATFMLPAVYASEPATGANKPADGEKQAVDYLEQYKEFDGKCMGLRRGDIRMIRNTHPDRAIQYRMVRLLGGQRQASIIRDTIEPGEEGQKLGCELLDDREQTYEVVQARFVD